MVRTPLPWQPPCDEKHGNHPMIFVLAQLILPRNVEGEYNLDSNTIGYYPNFENNLFY